MPSTAYTIVLWETTNMGFPFPHNLPSPPAGFVWVVRDVTMRFQGTSRWPQSPDQGRLLVDGQQLAATPAYQSVAGVLYEFRDIRQTLTSGSSVTFNANQAGWDLRATGYQLTQ
jgi:hypothetical protein